jgi:hypothetical protein
MDRSRRNPNLLQWRGMWLIDHGATLSFHHRWSAAATYDDRLFDPSDHVLLSSVPDVASADEELGPKVIDELVRNAVDDVPAEWLADESGFASVNGRTSCVAPLTHRGGGTSRDSGGLAAGSGSTRVAQWPTCLVWGTVMSDQRSLFEYAILRVVPRVERGESMNAGILLYCRSLDYLGSRVLLDRQRLAALDPTADADQVERALAAAAECALQQGDDIGKRFRWLTAPRSTVVQPGPVHTGLTADPDAETQRLFALLVQRLPSEG